MDGGKVLGMKEGEVGGLYRIVGEEGDGIESSKKERGKKVNEKRYE